MIQNCILRIAKERAINTKMSKDMRLRAINQILSELRQATAAPSNFLIISEINADSCDVSGRNLFSLPTFANVTSLYCENNNLTRLPRAKDLPHLRFLNCANNFISRIPKYKYLVMLTCKNNLLTFLPSLPNLIMLNFSNNRIRYIPRYRYIEVIESHRNNPMKIKKVVPVFPTLQEIIINNHKFRKNTLNCATRTAIALMRRCDYCDKKRVVHLRFVIVDEFPVKLYFCWRCYIN